MPNDNIELADFLAGTAPAVAVVEPDDIPAPAPVVVVEETIEPPPPFPPPGTAVVNWLSKQCAPVMQVVLADLKRIGMVAKNMHYRYHGKEFYGMHLLADLVADIANLSDELVEVYFMGELQADPPTMEDMCRLALDIDVLCPKDNMYYVGGLKSICLKAIDDVERAKKEMPELKSGTIAVLDSISQKCLVAVGLLEKTLNR